MPEGTTQTASDIKAIQEKVEKESLFVRELLAEMGKVIVGQKYLVERLLIGLLANGHILIEGVPGLAKTLSIKTLSDAIQTKFQRIQFTPDLLPADLIGTMIYNPQSGSFTTKKGPLFTNLILADEINRAPAKVQSALLEAMQERQGTIGENSFKLEEPFLVMATQNPIEQEGTYPLPEAQVDRFMLKLSIGYPNKKEELEIIDRNAEVGFPEVKKIISPNDILKAREVVGQIYVDEKIKDYILNIGVQDRSQGFDLLRGFTPGIHLFELGCQSPCLCQGTGIRYSGGRQSHRHGRVETPGDRHLRGGSGRDHLGGHRQEGIRSHRGSIIFQQT